jgi:hypothetical protein
MARGGDARLVALATQGRVEVLGSPPGEAGLVAHAQGIAERVDEWRSAGWTVAVDCRRERDAPRWRTLTGLPDTGSVVRPDVVLIDQADRRATPELLSLFAARSRDGLTLMVEGGTMPRRSEPASLGLVVLGDRLGRVRPEAGSTHPAIEELVGRWVALPGGPATALLVGLGPEEAQALNLSARRWATEVGRLDGDGPAVKAAGREYQAGDRVMVVNSEGIDRSRGSLGTVEQARASTRSLTVRWDDRSVEILSGSALRSLGYGYAATPELAGRIPGPALFLLGPEQAVPGLARRVLASATTPDLPMGPARQRDVGLGL